MTWLKVADVSVAPLGLSRGCATDCDLKKSSVCSKKILTAGLKKKYFHALFQVIITNEYRHGRRDPNVDAGTAYSKYWAPLYLIQRSVYYSKR